MHKKKDTMMKKKKKKLKKKKYINLKHKTIQRKTTGTFIYYPTTFTLNINNN